MDLRRLLRVRLTLPLLVALACTASPSGAAETAAAAGPIQKLVEEKKHADAIQAVDELRSKSGKGVASAEAEFWAGKAFLGLKNQDDARERFLLVAKTWPDHELAGEAAVEASVTRLRLLDGGKATDPKDLALAKETAAELEAAGDRYAKQSPHQAARALYIAGNARRIADEEPKAIANWEKVRATFDEGEYRTKATYMLANFASRDFIVPRARELFGECSRAGDATAGKCSKSLARLNLVGTPAGSITAETWFVGAPVDLASLRGNVVLLWFFATWCPHCKETMPEIADLVEKFSGKPFRVVAVTANNKGQTTAEVKQFVADPQWEITYPVAVDLDSRTSSEFESLSVPAAVLIDKKGNIRWADHPVYLHAGMIERLLAE